MLGNKRIHVRLCSQSIAAPYENGLAILKYIYTPNSQKVKNKMTNTIALRKRPHVLQSIQILTEEIKVKSNN